MNNKPFSETSGTLAETSRSITKVENNLSSLSFLGRLLSKENKLNNALEAIVDIDRDLEIYSNHQLTLLNPKSYIKQML